MTPIMVFGSELSAIFLTDSSDVFHDSVVFDPMKGPQLDFSGGIALGSVPDSGL